MQAGQDIKQQRAGKLTLPTNAKIIKKAVKEAEIIQWVGRVQVKSVLEMCKAYKGEIWKDIVYNNTRSAALLEVSVGVFMIKYGANY